jgi:hypothetical protein
METLVMKYWFHFLADASFLLMCLAVMGLLLCYAASPEQFWSGEHPAACHGYFVHAPASVVAARDAALVRDGAIEIPTHED